MSYEPTNWQTGDTITAEKLNNIEQGMGSVKVIEPPSEITNAILSAIMTTKTSDAFLNIIETNSEEAIAFFQEVGSDLAQGKSVSIRIHDAFAFLTGNVVSFFDTLGVVQEFNIHIANYLALGHFLTSDLICGYNSSASEPKVYVYGTVKSNYAISQ
ncbi:MAG: hypothetical protein II453_09260 [Alphaproteobacteria bacterium]|nr:hypothetical protein [Alphaproteobacteria bacterium]